MVKRSRTEWRKLFRKLGDQQRNTAWDIGDAILQCRKELGEEADQYIAETNLDSSSLYNAERVAGTWPPEERDRSVGYAFYRDAGTNKEIATKLIERARKNGWSRDQLRKARRELVKLLS